MSPQSIRLLEMTSSTHSDGNASGGTAARDEAYCSPVHVRVSTGDVLPLLVDAALTNRAWIEDFADDTMHIPQDLYDVLLAYRRFRQGAA